MTAKKILIINGHPDKESYCHALTQAYCTGAVAVQAQVEILHIIDLKFNPNLEFGYRKRTELEPDLLDAQQKIKWAEHIVWVYPVWWGSYPAIMKGFIDRVLLPGFAFQKRPDSVWWDKYLTKNTARIICTMDQPSWYYSLVYRAPSTNALKKLTLEFVGMKSVRCTSIGPVRLSKPEFRAKWLKKVEELGRKQK